MSAAAEATLRRWKADPVAFVRENFNAEPDLWQREALEALPVDPRIAMKACKGPGKSCVMAWCAWWILLLHPDAQGICLSITEDNLKDGLWKELSVWYAVSQILQVAFVKTGEYIRSRERPDTWFLHARSFPAQADKTQQANSLAGLHAKTVFVLLDELGDYPDGVLAAAEGIFAVEGQRGWIIGAGNPTRSSGPLFRICTRERGHWHVITITGDPDNPKRSPRIDIEFARQQIATHGRENPWVQINILGEFPSIASDQLINPEKMGEAQQRDLSVMHYQDDAVIWGLDPSRFGDDEMALARRQGLLMRRMLTWRNLTGPQLARAVLAVREQCKPYDRPDKLFVDVGGVGSSCYDHLIELGHGRWVVPVDFGSGADSPALYANKRAEIWDRYAHWINERPACVPSDPQLFNESTAPTFSYKIMNKRTVMLIESKESMKKRGVQSPNRADAAALTFTSVVAARSEMGQSLADDTHHCVTSHSPFARQPQAPTEKVLTQYNVFDSRRT